MSSNLSSLTNKQYGKKFIEEADQSPSKQGASVGKSEKLVRLNVDIPASLRQELKKLAVNECTTVRALVLLALETSVKRHNKTHTSPPN